MTAYKKTEMLKQQPKSAVPDPRAEATIKRNIELTEAEHERVQGGFCDGSVRFTRA
jgi:hypothetical protein